FRWRTDILRNNLLFATLTLARAGKHVEAAARAGTFAAEEPDGDSFYNLACVFALCAKVVRTSDTKLAESYAVQAVEMLGRSAAEGYFADPKNRKQLQGDADLDVLRERADFKKWFSSLPADIGK